MRVLLINQFYPPDVAPTGRYLHELAQALAAAGHRVTVVTSRRAYGGGGDYAAHEWLDGVEVVRLAGFGFGRASYAGKLLDYVGYYGRLALQLARHARPELIVALTTPPFVGLLARLAANARGARHAHWIMDVYPDVMKAHGMIDGVAYVALQRVARASLSGASMIIALGPSMVDKLRGYADRDARIEAVPLWAPPELAPWPAHTAVPLRAARGWSPDRLVLMYSGNMGLGHRFEEFLAAAERLGARGPHWVFAGTGRSRPQVEAFAAAHPQASIELLPYAPEAQLREHLCSADVHLVSLDARWAGSIFPSKLQASFALGKPVIFVGTTEQDMARWVRESGGGWVVHEDDVDGLIDAIAQAGDAHERARRGALAHAYAARELHRGTNLGRLVHLLTA
jgi:colanic acid biosynthesis glycosyl transferase WcaI